jgi:hypothetical protein
MTLSPDEFPRLTPDNHRESSPAAWDYNCVAWAAEDTENWWQPGVYWPVEVSKDEFGVGALAQAFRALGYESCARDEDLEPGFQKVALYGSGLIYTHAARQLPTGKWTSKLGGGVDIEHDTPDAVAGGIYGEVVEVMKRAVTPPAV